MAVGVSSGLERLSFGDRPDFGSPYPEGIAVGQVQASGNASGGAVTLSLLSDGGFLFRLEMLQVIRGDEVTTDMSIIVSHRWAADRSPATDANDFDMNWQLVRQAQGGFTVARLNPDVGDMVRRFPIGRTDNVALQTVFTFFDTTNTDGTSYEFNVICSYWRREALYRPGFLAAFYESPVVPLVPLTGR